MCHSIQIRSFLKVVHMLENTFLLRFMSNMYTCACVVVAWIATTIPGLPQCSPRLQQKYKNNKPSMTAPNNSPRYNFFAAARATAFWHKCQSPPCCDNLANKNSPISRSACDNSIWSMVPWRNEKIVHRLGVSGRCLTIKDQW